MKISLVDWKFVNNAGEARTIGGNYKVMCGDMKVAEKAFNDGYSALKIPIPLDVLEKANALDTELQNLIENYFKK